MGTAGRPVGGDGGAMTSARIAAALAHSSETRVVELGRGAVTQTGSRFLQLFGRRPAVILADGNHWQAAGAPVLASLAEAGIRDVRMHLFPATPTLYASYERVEEVREFLAPLEAVPIAIASGSLNDIVKLACGELGREYMCVATAASMDGYIAFGASVTRDGFKSQFTCPAPAGLIADVDIMAAAPPRLTATGFADLIEKIPAGADWILADELGVETLDRDVFDLMQGAMPQALADPEGCRLGAPEAIEGLGEGLVLSGLAMQAYRTARPASGGGHHFSHTWEMGLS